MSSFRRGTRLGIDVGQARIGVSRCDPDGMLAIPVETVARDEHSLQRISELIAEHEPIEIIVGLPVNLRGEETLSTQDARGFADDIVSSTTVPVRLVDERLSTVSAQTALRQSGRKTKGSRGIIDQIAAVVFLQHAIDTEKSTGRAPGHIVTADAEEPDNA